MRRGTKTASAASASRSPARAERLRLLFLASEAEPFAKTGGLGDVVGALSTALTKLGHDVRVVLPLYRAVPRAGLRASDPLVVALGAEQLPAKTWKAPLPGGTAARPGSRERRAGEAVFIDLPNLYDRDGLYQAAGKDHPDNLRRFSALCQAGLRLA
ncbi:MAG: glycogen/starch synthase, partial [Dehalococcoidia bacterium]|nr:glycogen/starch synthase [Dehalococcoidia bacterium]